ncbi:MAG: Gfo/Idh/MocA family oxidoreductase [Myxococcales bacterium]|nr:Gfo/Idh/MocA family oxidoreductase [Myxococcales bacterium]
MSATSALRVAVIGGGFGQQVHVPAFRQDARASVALLCMSTEARAREVASRLGVPRASGSWAAVVEDPAIDIVTISVPPALQAEIALAAVTRGKHVFLEKPVAMTAEQARPLAQALAANPAVVCAVDFEFRELAAWQRARQLLAEGAIGKLRHVYLNWRAETFAYRDLSRKSWKREREAGGGTLNLFVAHSVDLVAWMLAPIARVAGRLTRPAPDAAESRVDAWLALADGTPVTLAVAADATGASEHRMEFYGDDGAMVLDNRGGDYAAGFSLTVSRRGQPPAQVELPVAEPGDGRVLAVASLVRRFLDATGGGASVSPGLADGLAAQRALDALREADRTGTWQSLS